MHSKERVELERNSNDLFPKLECAMLKQNVFCANMEAGVGEEGEPIF